MIARGAEKADNMNGPLVPWYCPNYGLERVGRQPLGVFTTRIKERLDFRDGLIGFCCQNIHSTIGATTDTQKNRRGYQHSYKLVVKLLHCLHQLGYRMPIYRRVLSERAVKPSVSRKGNCYDNAAMELLRHAEVRVLLPEQIQQS